MKRLLFYTCLLSLIYAGPQDSFNVGSPKTWPQAKIDAWYAAMKRVEMETDRPIRRDAIISGNQIRTIIWDNGSIGQPGREPSMEWPIYSTHGYAYEFGPLVAAEVPVDANGRFVPYVEVDGKMEIGPAANESVGGAVHYILTDGLRDGGAPGESEEVINGVFHTWEPLPGFAREPYSENPSIALSHKRLTWPVHWPAWPGTYQVGAATADQAALYVTDDRDHQEFIINYDPPFYPFWIDENTPDETIGGLGLRVEVRIYQWSNPLANDAIFAVYAITNTSENDYEKVVFGMFGDPHIGGSNDFSDDYAYFDKRINMVYGYDADMKGDWGGVTGWLGYMFLESPSNEYDGIDNDDDGMVDESMFNGIDDDGDWDPMRDDVGVDGIGPQSPYWVGPDYGEGDGVPTAGDPFDPLIPGEPNFDGTDLDEADQIGLTSFNAYEYGWDMIRNDENMWERMTPYPVIPYDSAFTDISQNADNIFLYGSGYFPLRAGDTKRFSVAVLMGNDEKDLFYTASIVQHIYNSGYRFAKAPDKPVLTTVPEDGKVTLYWDDLAEQSWDPAYGYDFQGYSIYRATDPGFQEVYTITDNYGNPTLWKPLARFDLVDGITGESVVGIRGVHFDLGSDTGLRHEFVDNTVINGVTYYYTVTSYDFGDTTGLIPIPPTESTKIINKDAYTGIVELDVNTAVVTPSAPAPGTIYPEITSLEHLGAGTGEITIKFINPAIVRDGVTYTIYFGDPFYGPADTVMYITEETLYSTTTVVNDTNWISISEIHQHMTDIGVVRDPDGAKETVPDSLYNVNLLSDKIRFDDSLVGATVQIDYKNQPVWQSRYFDSEDANTVFDGIRIYVDNHVAEINEEETGWLEGETNYEHLVGVWDAGTNNAGFKYPHSYEIVWQNNYVPSIVDASQSAPFIIYDVTYPDHIEVAPYFIVPTTGGKFDIDKTTIGILSEPVLDVANKTWGVRFLKPIGPTPQPPQPGDVFRLKIGRPFSDEDVFTFTTTAAGYDGSSVASPLDSIMVVPNPYLAQSIYETKSGFAAGRGDRQIQFINLPPTCTIKIFTIAGELVQTIEHDESFWNGRESYNLLNKENMEIAFGVYIWHVDASASELGKKIGKFAVIK